MGLRESRIINSVHPWLGARLRWLQEVAQIVGGSQSLISGVRTRREQRELFETVFDRPVAAPGCSQHNYGFAADAVWGRITQISSKGRAKLFTLQESQQFMESAARHAQLTLVAGDPGHVQMYPGSEFRAWAVDRGLCAPNQPRFGTSLRQRVERDLQSGLSAFSDALSVAMEGRRRFVQNLRI